MSAGTVVNLFLRTFNITNCNYYAQLGIANKLLNKYSEEELITMIKYYKSNLGTKGVRSLGFFLVAGDDLLNKAKSKECKEAILNKIENKPIEQKRNKRKSILKGGCI